MQAQEYNFIKHKVRKLIDVDLNGYKSAQMQRRLGTYLLRLVVLLNQERLKSGLFFTKTCILADAQ